MSAVLTPKKAVILQWTIVLILEDMKRKVKRSNGKLLRWINSIPGSHRLVAAKPKPPKVGPKGNVKRHISKTG